MNETAINRIADTAAWASILPFTFLACNCWASVGAIALYVALGILAYVAVASVAIDKEDGWARRFGRYYTGL